MRYKCHTSGVNYLSPVDACILGENTESWAVFGDSHGVEISSALSLKAAHTGVKQLTFSDCGPVLSSENTTSGCHAWLNEALQYLISNDNIKNVLVTFRHQYHIKRFVAEPNHDVSEYWQYLSTLLETLSNSGKKVIILMPVPELSEHIDKLLVPHSIFSKSGANIVSENLLNYRSRNADVLTNLKRIVTKQSLEVVSTIQALCDQVKCFATNENSIFYFDDNHLSIAGALKVLSNLKITETPTGNR
ncbi:SGNH hydrolase domain-containing protein [Psychrosphaera algicola]|uniref:SGNH hydrolase domain-containing protein n=1 Tax=Psychrosphaera algicola TaxID=3023714 RepID=A0ABT5FEQ7_9GAMM|nr:SGNH hydrolase domain-containing protein [Psychrosphaera sp. G1-22]MDC2890035.1 SGNH hydrolase domain-containing protein [Psychrosphaera sp. G1-22]